MKRLFKLSFLLLCLSTPYCTTYAKITVNPIPGGIAKVILNGIFETRPHIAYQGNRTPVEPDGQGRWYAYVGIPIDTPGRIRKLMMTSPISKPLRFETPSLTFCRRSSMLSDSARNTDQVPSCLLLKAAIVSKIDT